MSLRIFIPLFLLMLLISYACREEDEVVAPLLTEDKILAKWSITESLRGIGGGLNETYAINRYTLEFYSPTQVRMMNVDEYRWFWGTYSLDEDQNRITITTESDSSIILQVNQLETLLAEVTVLSDTTAGTFGTLRLRKIPPGPLPFMPDSQWRDTWNLKSFNLKYYRDLDSDGNFKGEFDQVIRDSLSGIINRRTTYDYFNNGNVRLLDSYRNPRILETDSWLRFDDSNYLVTDPDGLTLILHLIGNPTFLRNEMTHEVIGFDRPEIKGIGTPLVWVEGTQFLTRSNDDDPRIIAISQLLGQWEVTVAETERIFNDGTKETTTGDYTQGDEIIFFENNTGTLNGETFSYQVPDPFNLRLQLPNGEEEIYYILNANFEEGNTLITLVTSSIDFDVFVQQDVRTEEIVQFSLK